VAWYFIKHKKFNMRSVFFSLCINSVFKCRLTSGLCLDSRFILRSGSAILYWDKSTTNSVPSSASTSLLPSHLFFFCNSPQWARASSFTSFLDHTQRRTTVGRTPLDEWSARRRYLYLTTYNGQISMPPLGIRIHNISWRATADVHLRPRGH
jgi:hypothetical protein